MKICIKNVDYNNYVPSNKREFEEKKEHERILGIYRETGKCPYCGSSVKYLGEDVYKEKDWGDKVVSIKEVDKEFLKFLKGNKTIQNHVLDAGWTLHLKCEACSYMPMLDSVKTK